MVEPNPVTGPAPWPGEDHGPCLNVAQEPRPEHQPCLDFPAELPPEGRPEAAPGPCLKVAPEPAPAPGDDGRMCLSELDPEGGTGALPRREPVEDVLARGVLPDDVAALLRARRTS